MEQKEIETITRQAKDLLDKFSKALDSVKNSGESNVERAEDRRKEGNGTICDNDFRKIMFENAPSHDDNFIIAEKKTW